MTVVTFVLNIVTFTFVHNLFKFLQKYPQGWQRLTSYAVGVLFTFPFFVIHLQNEKPQNAYMLSFLASGIGTAFGWMLEDNAKS